MAKFLLVYTFIFIPLFWWTAWPSAQASSIAIDKERGQLLKDAVGWMTFRKNGRLMKEEELAPLFVDPLHEKYVKSKFYRTFVIAFQKGVLPKLTLQENQPCDPAYVKEYTDPLNNSVTWHFQKKFTFDMYSKRDSSCLQLCDYRQGLICSPQAKKCQCPEGASMSPIDTGSSVKRCLLKQDEICALIDIDHGNDPQHTDIAVNMYHLAFNLEKPSSYQPGTQCRFKDNAKVFPKCYSSTSGPFDPPKPPPGSHWNYRYSHIALGAECTIGLYANPGSCPNRGGVGLLNELVCYNFGPSRGSSGNVKDFGKIGFCSSYFGSFGITGGYGSGGTLQYQFHPLFSPFVHPRSVPLRGQAFRDYLTKFCDHVQPWIDVTQDSRALTNTEGGKCSVAKTEEFEKAWQYFADLEGPPASGSDYVASATKAELDANLQTMVDFGRDGKKGDQLKTKMCRIFVKYRRSHIDSPLEMEPGFKCVQEGNPDANGNDGKCREPPNFDTKAFAKRLQDVLDHASVIRYELDNQETNYDDGILKEFPEPPCKLELVPLPEARARSGEALEGGYCPDGSVCYDDFSDAREIYDTECNLKDDAKQRLVCHDITEPLGKCEDQYLKGKVDQALKKLESYAKLQKGEKCYPEFEKVVRSNDIGNMSQYQILSWLNRGVLCDQEGSNLECSSDVATCQDRKDVGEKKPGENEANNGGCAEKDWNILTILLVLGWIFPCI